MRVTSVTYTCTFILIHTAHAHTLTHTHTSVCDVNLDLVFMLDQSGSVGAGNHAIALQFIQNVVTFFSIAPNATQVPINVLHIQYHVCMTVVMQLVMGSVKSKH